MGEVNIPWISAISLSDAAFYDTFQTFHFRKTG